MSRSKHFVTDEQVTGVAKIISVEFVSGGGYKQHCHNHKCKNKATQCAKSSTAEIPTCDDSYCRIYAALLSHYFGLPNSAQPRLQRIGIKVKRPNTTSLAN